MPLGATASSTSCCGTGSCKPSPPNPGAPPDKQEPFACQVMPTPDRRTLPRLAATAYKRGMPSGPEGELVRVLVALGGNAMTSAQGSAHPADQVRAINEAMEHVAELVAAGHD